MVVGGGGEEVAERVECQGPDVRVVGLGEGCARGRSGGAERGFGRAEVPVEDGAFGATRDEEGVNWVPGDGWEKMGLTNHT